MHVELSPLIVWIAPWILNTYSEFQLNIFSNNRDIKTCQSFRTTRTTTTPRLQQYLEFSPKIKILAPISFFLIMTTRDFSFEILNYKKKKKKKKKMMVTSIILFSFSQSVFLSVKKIIHDSRTIHFIYCRDFQL